MRKAGRGGYTDAQVIQWLKDPAKTTTIRVELLDQNYQVVDPNMPTIPKKKGSVSIEMNVDSKIKSFLHLVMNPDPRLVGVTAFKYFLKPYYRLLTPYNDWIEFPLGVYVWSVPARQVNPRAEKWTVKLPDQLFLLDSASPGIGGFGALQNEPQTNALKRLALFAGISNHTGIQDSGQVLQQTMQWGLARVEYAYGVPYIPGLPADQTSRSQNTRTTTLLDIAIDLTNGIGYYTPYFDLDGVLVCRPTDDLRIVGPSMVYGSERHSITLNDITTDTDLTRIANRIIVFSDNPSAQSYPQQADADLWYPGHPWSPTNIAGPGGPRYLDKQISEPTADTPQKAFSRAFAELGQALAYYQTVSWTSKVWPLHEAFDPLGMYVPGDAEFNDLQLFHERSWGLDPMDERMRHQGRRVYKIPAGLSLPDIWEAYQQGGFVLAEGALVA